MEADQKESVREKCRGKTLARTGGESGSESTADPEGIFYRDALKGTYRRFMRPGRNPRRRWRPKAVKS